MAVIGVAAFSLCVLAYLAWITFEDAPLGEFVEGEHYLLVENPRRIRSENIEVMEFFSYACVHCYNFDPILAKWVEKNQDRVTFVATPAVSSDYWRLLGRAYYSLERLEMKARYHLGFFRSIHEARQVYNSPEKIFDHFESAGIDRKTFKATFNSTEVSTKITRADEMARRLKVAAVPTIVVQGKYIVRTSSTVGVNRMLDVMDHLVDKELAERATQEKTTGG